MQQVSPEHPIATTTIAAHRPLPPDEAALAPWWPTRTRRGFVAVVLILAMLLGISAMAFAISSTTMQYPAVNAFVRPYLAVAPILIGLYWKVRRPESPFGMLLIASGLAAYPLAWAASDDPALHTIGVLVGDTANTLAIFYLALAFPVGNLRGRADGIVMALLAVALTARLVWAVGLPAVAGGGPISRCIDACPTNPFVVSVPAGLAEIATVVEAVLLVSATVLLIGVISHRLLRSPRPRRRALLTVALTSLLFFPLYLLYQLTRRFLGVEAPIVEAIAWVQIMARIVFPLGFALALLRADLFANGALRSLLDRLADRPSPDQWRAALAESLDDPSLRLGFWDPQQRVHREPDGRPLDDPGPGTATVSVSRDGQPVAALAVDEVLLTDPELLHTATTATLLAVELGTLEGELRASQRAAVTAGDAARRRVAQDLHDSAQQRLTALRMQLAIARDEARRPDDRQTLARLGREVDEAIGEIRAVLRGTRTDDLRRDGLRVALETAARSTTAPVRYVADGIGRYADDVEEAAFYTVLEALQNVAKHNPPGTRATVTLSDSGDELTFVVEDGGVGFDPRRVGGTGLAGMTARVGAVGGHLRIDAAAGAGTRVSGGIPLFPAVAASEADAD
jgi:signal transduction histidine kinase